MRGSMVLALSLAACLTGSASCGSSATVGPDSGSGSGSSSGGGSPPEPCTSAEVPSTVHLTVSGFAKCSCFNGSFTLTKEMVSGNPAADGWASPPITGCPGQTDTAYLKFSLAPFGLGVADLNSEPGSGNSDFAPVASGTCSPFSVSGLGAENGNITAFCPSVEDESMVWSVTQ